MWHGQVSGEAGQIRARVMTEPTSWDEDKELAAFLPPEAGAEASPLRFLTKLLQTLDHPTYRAMSPGKQQLYLQLLRWSHGQQQEAIEASRVQMSAWTGLAWDTIKKYIPSLIEDKLVQIVRPATSINPAMYEVYWLPPPPRPTLDQTAPLETIRCYVDQFDAEDLAEYQRLTPLLTGAERKQLHSEVSWSLRDLGIPWNYELMKKLVMWQFLIHSPYRRQLEAKHPEWFSTPAV